MMEVISGAVAVYGTPLGWKPPTEKEYHGTTYLEYEIPKRLEKKLSRLIEAELKKFHKKCKCDNCKKRRSKQ